MAKARSWQELKAERMPTQRAQEGYENAAISYELGQQVRRLRQSQGLSQAELARAIRTTQSAIARLEGGGTVPTLPTLSKLAKALGVELVLSLEETSTTPRQAN